MKVYEILSLLAEVAQHPVSSDVEVLLSEKVALEQASREITQLRARVDTALGEALGQYQTEIDGVGVVKRTKLKDRSAWDKEALLSAVYRSNIVNKETGEIKEESHLEKVLAVWNLSAPRTSVLTERGIDPDEYCVLEVREGWKIQII